MANVRNNIFIRGLNGDLGKQFRVTTNKVTGRTTVSAITDFEKDREYTPAQLAQQQAFREAAAYGQAKRGEEIYIAKADGSGRSPYNIALADWFHRPEILEVDLSGWTNGSGGVIRLRAQDDVLVVGVRVAIADETGALLEEGEAQDMGALWWEYTTSQPYADTKQVTIAARDLPGHVTEWSEMLGHPRMP